MRAPVALCSLAIILQLTHSAAFQSEVFAEELLVQKIADDAVLAHLELGSSALLNGGHTHTVPPVLRSLAARYQVAHLQLAVTRGRWDWEQQHGPAAAAASPRPAGLELKVTFQPGAADTQAAYAALTQELGGLLCAAAATAPQLAVMAAPHIGWWHPLCRPAAPADADMRASSGERQVYAWLPQEVVCTENVAAWRRLLPCRHHAGLAALLQPVRLAAASYLSLGLQLWVDDAVAAVAANASSSSSTSSQAWQQQPTVQVRQALTAVLPLPAQHAAPVQHAAAAERQPGLLEAVFGTAAPPGCAAASSSTVYVAGAASDACRRVSTLAGALLACGLDRGEPHLPVSLLQTSVGSSSSRAVGGGGGSSSSSSSSSTGALSEGANRRAEGRVQAVQHIVQRGTLAGTVVLGVRVPRSATPVPADVAGRKSSSSGGGTDARAAGSGGGALLHVMQLLPWQLLVEPSSLKVSLDGRALRPGSAELAWASVDARPDSAAAVELLVQLPGRPPVAEVAEEHATVEPSATGPALWHELTVIVGFRTAFVGVFDHAPDASRGVDIPPALATWLPAACTQPGSLLNSSEDSPASASETAGQGWSPLLERLQRDCGARQGYSNGGGGSVVPLPIPDFSMPFNVICFTSTLLAVVLGGAANTVLRRPEELAGVHTPGGPPAWKRKLRRMAALLLLMGAVAVYLDKDLQRQLDTTLHRWVLGRHGAPEQHGEL